MRVARRQERTGVQTPTFIGAVEPHSLEVTTPAERQFAEAFARFYDGAIDRAQRVLGYDAASDVIQRTAMEVWRQWHELPPELHNEIPFYRTFALRIKDEMRRQTVTERKRVEITDELEEAPEFQDLLPAKPEAGDVAKALDRIVAAMPERPRQVLLLFHEQQMSHQQIADTLGITPGTSMNHLLRARRFIEDSFRKAGYRITEGPHMKLLPPSTSEGGR